MPRPSSLSRKRVEEVKEWKKVCFIATEDSKTGAYQYFEELGESDEYHFSEKYSFKLEIFPSVGGKSSPNHVLENIKAKMMHLGFDQTTDKYWIVCDVDRWDKEGIDSVISECEQINVDYAFSNPCSEIWILYHQEDFDNTEPFETSAACKATANALLHKREKYSNLLTEQQVDYACAHAEKFHVPKTDKWPKSQGSHIYKIIRYLLGA